jgi:DNA-binding MarR family transcriptional regulator
MEIKKKVINIPTSLHNLYKHYLTILKPINKLGTKEIELLAYMMYLNEIEKENILKAEDRWNKIFSYDGRIKIRDKLDMSEYSLNNYITALRKKGLIIDNQIPDKYIPDIEKTDKFQLIFNFKING